MANELDQWIEQVVDDRYDGVAGRLARAIDMSESAFSRGRRLGTFDVDSLLLLAEVTGEPASRILGIAGKAHIARLIERQYGQERPPLPSDVRAVVDFLTDRSAPGPIQREMIATAKWWKDWPEKPASTGERNASKRAAKTSTPAKTGSR